MAWHPRDGGGVAAPRSLGGRLVPGLALQESAELCGAGRRGAAGGRGKPGLPGPIWAVFFPALSLSFPSIQGACGPLDAGIRDCHFQMSLQVE